MKNSLGGVLILEFKYDFIKFMLLNKNKNQFLDIF